MLLLIWFEVQWKLRNVITLGQVDVITFFVDYDEWIVDWFQFGPYCINSLSFAFFLKDFSLY